MSTLNHKNNLIINAKNDNFAKLRESSDLTKCFLLN